MANEFDNNSLLPVMAFSYFFQFLDKTALNATAILGIREDLHLSGSEYSWSSAIYYFGYLVASYPISLMMVRWRVGKSISISMSVSFLCIFSCSTACVGLLTRVSSFTWGAILMLTAACHNAAGLLATRIFLGVAEAAIAPGLTVIISMWYKRKEQPLRHAAWFLGNTFAGIFGALLSYGIGHIGTIAPWKVCVDSQKKKKERKKTWKKSN
jgi:MFS family permease